MRTNRDDFSQDTIQRAAKRVGYRCSCPECRVPTVGPSEESEKKVANIGEASHICAAAPGGPRYNPEMTPEERKSITNCIWLCRKHARLIDMDSKKYTIEVLRKWKEDAEKLASQELGTELRYEIISGGQPLTDIPMPVNLLGREYVISEIKERLRENSIICITAVGGIGKSAVAATICNDYKYKSGREDELFKYVAWITSTGDLRKDLCKIELPQGFSTTSEEEKFQIIYRWLKDPDNSVLLVIDNMDTPPTGEEKTILNTVSGKTKVIVTSRANIDAFFKVNLSEIDDQSAICLFYRHFLGCDEPIDSIRGRDDYSIVEEIVAGASNNALLIELIGKMAYSENKELSEIWKMLNENVIGIESELSIETAHAESHGLNLAGDENLTLQEQVRRLYLMSGFSDEQRNIMCFLVLFPIGTKVYHKILDWYRCSKKDIHWLQKRGWIKREGDSYIIHPIVKSSVELQNMESGYTFELTRLFNLIARLINTEEYLPNKMQYIEYRERAEVPKVICSLIENLRIIGELPFALCLCVAKLFNREGNYYESIKYSFKALSILKMQYEEDNEYVAVILDSVGMMYFELCQYDKALEFLNKGLEIKSKLYEEDDLNMAISYNDLAEVYDKLGDYEKSESYFNKALDILVDQLGEYNLHTVNTYDNLANMYCDWGKYEEALKFHSKALVYYEAECGEKDPETATAYNNMGSTYYNMGDYQKAKFYLEKSLAIRNEILDSRHPYIMITLSILKNVYQALGDSDALKETQRVLEDVFDFDEEKGLDAAVD